jgi:hypothetical protein
MNAADVLHTKDLKSSGIEAGVMFFENEVNE